jgi:hypothetical protein
LERSESSGLALLASTTKKTRIWVQCSTARVLHSLIPSAGLKMTLHYCYSSTVGVVQAEPFDQSFVHPRSDSVTGPAIGRHSQPDVPLIGS